MNPTPPLPTTPGLLGRRLAAALLGVLLAVPAANLDALLAGHRHETADGVVHHRHLYAGAHEHAELVGAQDEHHDDHDDPDHESPGETPNHGETRFAPSVLLLVEAGEIAPRLPLVSATSDQASSAGHTDPERPAPRYLPTAQRPPPSV